MEAIKTADLVKRYKDRVAVDKLNLEIREGELFSLLGVNGAGKTTTIKMLSCLTMPTAGDAFVGGHSVIGESGAVKRLIGVSPQESAVAPNLSVRENLALICGIHGFSREKTVAKIGELTGQLIPEEILQRKAGKLSGGEQRRLSIAMALIGEPRVGRDPCPEGKNNGGSDHPLYGGGRGVVRPRRYYEKRPSSRRGHGGGTEGPCRRRRF